MTCLGIQSSDGALVRCVADTRREGDEFATLWTHKESRDELVDMAVDRHIGLLPPWDWTVSLGVRIVSSSEVFRIHFRAQVLWAVVEACSACRTVRASMCWLVGPTALDTHWIRRRPTVRESRMQR